MQGTPAPGTGQGQDAGRHALARFATQHAVRRQRRVWSGRVASWDQHGSAGLTKVTAAILDRADAGPADHVVDLGCGTGQLSLPLANRGAQVLAVDVSPAMIGRMLSEAERLGVTSLDGVAMPVEELVLPPESVDLVVSSYAQHHLRDADKAHVVSAAFGWLRPGGRLMIADMMFGRGASSRDRAIIKSKVVALARKGPGGWWRIAKNAARYLLRVQERPVSMETWTVLLERSGFAGITATTIVAEAGIVAGNRPEGSPEAPQAAGSVPRR